METYNFCKETIIKYNVDTVVVGGGTAGCFAAIAAARNGAKTVLIEKNGILGGTMTVGGVRFPGLFFAWGEQIIAGPCWESILETVQSGGAVLPEITRKPAHHWLEQITLKKANYAYVLDSMCEREGVTVLLHTMVSDVKESADGVTVLVTGKEGLFAVQAKSLVDATGDADITAMLGYACEISAVQQPATLSNRLAGYDFGALDTDLVKSAVAQELREGGLYREITPDAIVHFLEMNRLDIHIPCQNGADSASRGELERASRAKVMDITAFLKRIPGLENLYVSEMCDECGVRETRRIVGEKKVTVDDYLSAKRFDDAICYAFYPVDLHVMHGIEQRFLPEGSVPTIPLGALIPRGADRLLVCGRSLSSDALANSALRVQAPCMATGQAAGCAAAQMARENKRACELDYAELCRELVSIGAIVPDVPTEA